MSVYKRWRFRLLEVDGRSWLLECDLKQTVMLSDLARMRIVFTKFPLILIAFLRLLKSDDWFFIGSAKCCQKNHGNNGVFSTRLANSFKKINYKISFLKWQSWLTKSAKKKNSFKSFWTGVPVNRTFLLVSIVVRAAIWNKTLIKLCCKIKCNFN